MSLNKYVDAGRSHNLEKILSAWVRLNRQYCISIQKETPWSYNERASLSVLAAAVWKAGGVALEEYSTRKGPNRSEWTGRCDIYCNIGTSHFAGESKMVWLPLLRKPKTNIRKIEKTLYEAYSDAKNLKSYEGRRFGICFAPVYLAEKTFSSFTKQHTNGIDERLLELQEEIQSANYDALAWCFPSEVRQLRDSRKWRGSYYYYPGLFAILREV